MPKRADTQMQGKIARLAARYLPPRQSGARVNLDEWPDWQLEDVGISRAARNQASATGAHLKHLALARYLSTSPG